LLFLQVATNHLEGDKYVSIAGVNPIIKGLPQILNLILHLYMQVGQSGTEQKACIKVFLCCQGYATFSLQRVSKACLKLQK